ncbi:MAG: glutathione S-transferase family protein [Deltaproteobacteria bacterium]|nr:glutathione S-transferase family protein [Deltaproteobacteria bacterium]
MSRPVRVIGSFISPYVRKVLAALHLKGIAYEVDPIVPFFGDERFAQLSPVRRIPVLTDDRVTLCDSTVICEYLDERHPTPPLFPRDVADRARARWLEEYADTRLGEVLIWKVFNQVAINPFVFGVPTDQAILQQALNEEVPQVLGYLESELPVEGFLFGAAPCVADLAIAAPFRNAAFAGFAIDAARWPRSAALVLRVWQLDAFQRLVPFEERSMRTPIAKVRSALAEIGAPLTAETFGTDTPRRGVMRI